MFAARSPVALSADGSEARSASSVTRDLTITEEVS